ncbi:MAG: hypothetical protein HQK65_08660 [Desulfamplus sp.]|nr:hypothetical protein [Desulfamplus sp.]
MSFFFDKKQTHIGMMNDDVISFNVRRSGNNLLRFPREVIVVLCEDDDNFCISIIPGIQKGEKALVKEIQTVVSMQNWKIMERHSFKISFNMFSFLWRFRTTNSWEYTFLTWRECVDSKQESKIRSAHKKYQDYLEHNLTPGTIYLLPDREIVFDKDKLFKQPYSHHVLVLSVKNDNVFFAPFSTRINRMNPAKDILIDSQYKGKGLDENVDIAVENFPYTLFKQKTALIVTAIQKKTKREFLNTALTSVGSVRKELLNFILTNR